MRQPSPGRHNTIAAALGGLFWPLLGGAAASVLFYALLLSGPLDDVPLARRYFASHPVAFITTGMFFVGLAALALKLGEVAGQRAALSKVRLDPPDRPLTPEDCGPLAESLDQLPAGRAKSHLAQRLRDALRHVQRNGSADQLDDELKHLADLGWDRQQQGHGLVNIVIWATPMLGFLGTVIGITQALGDLDPGQLASDPQLAMNGLLAGLYVAFDTTALSLTLSLVLMFLKFPVERLETQILNAVDREATDQLAGRFERLGTTRDPYVGTVQRIGQSVLVASEELVLRQAQLWKSSLEDVQRHSRDLVESAGQSMQSALHRSLQTLAETMERTRRSEAERSEQQLQRWNEVLSGHARVLQGQQAELSRHWQRVSQQLESAGGWHHERPRMERALRELAAAVRARDEAESRSREAGGRAA